MQRPDRPQLEFAALPGTNGSAALLADVLTKAGYATLRFDKRVTGPHAAENINALMGKISMQSHSDEVNSALAQLTSRRGKWMPTVSLYWATAKGHFTPP
ncbi:MAG: hypothetical protein R3C44_22490 [Chloroflexota bacterium]